MRLDAFPVAKRLQEKRTRIGSKSKDVRSQNIRYTTHIHNHTSIRTEVKLTTTRRLTERNMQPRITRGRKIRRHNDKNTPEKTRTT